MAENEVAPYDPKRLMDAVRDRIKAEFVGLIPEDTWKKMVKTEVEQFFAEKHDNAYGTRRELPSDFQRVVWQELDKATRAKMKEYLESEEWQGHWKKNQLVAGKAVRKLVVEKSGEIMANVLGSAIQATIEDMRNRM